MRRPANTSASADQTQHSRLGEEIRWAIDEYLKQRGAVKYDADNNPFSDKRWVRKNRQITGECCVFCGLQLWPGAYLHQDRCQGTACSTCGTRQCYNGDSEKGWRCKICSGAFGYKPLLCDFCEGEYKAGANAISAQGKAACKDHLVEAGLVELLAEALAKRALYWEEIEIPMAGYTRLEIAAFFLQSHYEAQFHANLSVCHCLPSGFQLVILYSSTQQPTWQIGLIRPYIPLGVGEIKIICRSLGIPDNARQESDQQSVQETIFYIVRLGWNPTLANERRAV